jgi:hypothetical protein
MKPNKGLSRNFKSLDQPSGTIRYGKNGLDSTTNASQNERGFSVCSAKIPFSVIGVVETNQDPIIFSTDNTNSAIGFFDIENDVYVPIVYDPTLKYKLDFNLENPIQGEYRRNYKGDIEVAFIEAGNPPRLLNTADVPSDLQGYLLFPEASEPKLDLSIISGGSLPLGAYYVAARYSNNDGTQTRYFTPSVPVFATSSDFAVTIGGNSGKAIGITITEADSRYDKIQLAIIRKAAGITTAVELPAVSIRAGQTITYSGNSGTDISLEEIIIPPAFYQNASTVTQLNDVLYMADVIEEQELNLQGCANNIKVKWRSEITQVAAPSAELTSGKKKTFKHDEVYALYAVFHLKSGKKTKAFHIPGPDAAAFNTPVTTDGKTHKAYQVQDTSTITGFKGEAALEGYTGGWINQTERYPDDVSFGALSGQQVRHHKMPALGVLLKKYGTKATRPGFKVGIDSLSCLGLTLDNVIIPDAYKDLISGWELFYAQRDFNNSLIASQGVLTFGADINSEPPLAYHQYFSSGGNFKTSMLDKSNAGTQTGYRAVIPNLKNFRFHGFDLMYNRPAVSPDYLKIQFRMKAGMQVITYNENVVSLFVDYTRGDATVVPASAMNILKGVSAAQYVPNMASAGAYNNLKAEGTFTGVLDSVSNVTLAMGEIRKPTDANPVGTMVSPNEETFLVDLISIKDDLYNSFYSQQLVRSGRVEYITDQNTGVKGTDFSFGGDCFLTQHIYNTYGLAGMQDQLWQTGLDYVQDNIEPKDGIKVARRFLCESSYNLWQRYKDPALPTSQFYPQTALKYLDELDRTVENNTFGISNESNSIGNVLNGISPYDVTAVNIQNSPYKIIRSFSQPREGKVTNWKNFSALDYFEAQKDMGPIVNLQGYDGKLIIHHSSALFVTQDKTTLQGDILSVTLGTGDIFRFPPKEGRSSKLGYAGTQHKLAAILTGYGYVFPDSQTGELFVLNDQGLQEISGELSSFLQKHLKVLGTNVLTSNGITIGYDNVFKRLLLTVKNSISSFTLSYSTLKKQWSYFHDYLPDYYIHTREHLYALKANKLYQMNTGEYGLYFKRDEHASFFIDVVFNAKDSLVLNSVSWKTEVNLEADEEQSTVSQMEDTISAITIWNNYQCTGRIVLDRKALTILNRNNRSTHQEWNFNDFRNLVSQNGMQFLEDLFKDFKVKYNALLTGLPWYDKGLMQGQFFVVRFEYQNNNNKQITIHEVDLSVSSLDNDQSNEKTS